jgi:Xaa-Pro aminopeptidase
MDMDFPARLERLHTLMLINHLDALVYGTGANFQYFTGLPVKWRRMEEPGRPECLLVVARDAEPRVIAEASAQLAFARHASPLRVDFVESRDELSSALQKALRSSVTRLTGLNPKIGTSLRAATYLNELISHAVPGAECAGAEALGETLRLVKDAGEVAALKRVAALTGKVMERVVPSIRAGIKQPELQSRVAEAGLELGADDVSFSPAALFVKSGTEPSETPFVYPPEKELVRETSIAFDFGFVLDGYCSDFGRSFYCGPAPGHIAGAYRALQESLCALVDAMKPGYMKMGDLFGMMEKNMDQRGYGDRLRARLSDGTLGHQIGVDLHENPWIRPGCETVLQPGMVMALEPKAWLPGEYYLRVEDIVLITSDGAEFLTSFNRDVFELPI